MNRNEYEQKERIVNKKAKIKFSWIESIHVDINNSFVDHWKPLFTSMNNEIPSVSMMMRLLHSKLPSSDWVAQRLTIPLNGWKPLFPSVSRAMQRFQFHSKSMDFHTHWVCSCGVRSYSSRFLCDDCLIWVYHVFLDETFESELLCWESIPNEWLNEICLAQNAWIFTSLCCCHKVLLPNLLDCVRMPDDFLWTSLIHHSRSFFAQMVLWSSPNCGHVHFHFYFAFLRVHSIV